MSHIPPGRSACCPFIVTRDAPAVIAFAKAVFGAEEIAPPLYRKDGRVWNAELRIGDVTVMIGAASEGFERPGFLYLYVEDVDATYAKALEHGAQPVMEPAQRFYGARDGGVQDAAGNWWWIGTQTEQLTHEEIAARARAEEEAR